MFSQFFGNYLLNKQKITNKQFISCMEYMRANRVKLENMIHHFDNLNVTACCANHLEHAKTKADAYGIKGCRVTNALVILQ